MKKITFKEACKIWLEQERKKSNMPATPHLNALRASYFSCFIDDKVERLTKDAIDAIWQSFEEHWLGSENELSFCRVGLRLNLAKICDILNENNRLADEEHELKQK